MHVRTEKMELIFFRSAAGYTVLDLKIHGHFLEELGVESAEEGIKQFP